MRRRKQKLLWFAIWMSAAFVVGVCLKLAYGGASTGRRAPQKPADASVSMAVGNAVLPKLDAVAAFSGGTSSTKVRDRGMHPRPPHEWQGMQVHLEDLPTCNAHCLAPFACVHGQCMPCSRDLECESGEACVLDHCLISANVGCRSVSDCPEDSLCVLSGYRRFGPNDAIPEAISYRGNEEMTAFCRANGGSGERGGDSGEDIPPEDEPQKEEGDDRQATTIDALHKRISLHQQRLLAAEPMLGG